MTNTLIQKSVGYSMPVTSFCYSSPNFGFNEQVGGFEFQFFDQRELVTRFLIQMVYLISEPF